MARIVEPASKANTVRILDELGVEHASLRIIFTTLQRCARHDYRSRVAAACFQHVAKMGDLSLVLYDVTTLYFEADKEDADGGANQSLRKVGYSKERRVDPQIVVGLLVDRSGFPLEMGSFKGNKAETKTLLPIVKDFQKTPQARQFRGGSRRGHVISREPQDSRCGWVQIHCGSAAD